MDNDVENEFARLKEEIEKLRKELNDLKRLVGAPKPDYIPLSERRM